MAEEAVQEDVFTGKLDLALWRKMLFFARPYRGHLILLMTLGAVVAGLDVLLPYLTGRIIDGVETGSTDAIRKYGTFYASVVVGFAACVFGFILIAGRIATGICYDIREHAFAKLQELPYSYYDHKAVGWLMARLTSDCNNLSRIMGWTLLDIAWGSSVLVMVTAIMFRTNWKLALLVLAVTPLLLLTSRYFSVRLLLTSRALRKANSQTTAAFNEGIVGVRTSKSMVREDRNLHEFSDLTGTMYGHALSNALYSALFLPLMLSICAIGSGLALWKGGLYVSTGALSLGTLVMFLQYAGFLQEPVQQLANQLTQIQGAQASAERIQSLLDADVEIRDSEEVRQRMESLRGAPAAVPPASTLPPADGAVRLAPDGLPARIDSIEFQDVSFAYQAGQKVLEHFNLRVEAGQTIALVGPTGGGKTTIVGLACRFYEPTAGRVLINGTDYRQRSLKWLQSNLGMVLQQPHLFSGTVRENIRYGRLSATDAEIEHAATMVNAHDFITGLKDGYNTAVGEGGNQLSTGQKQLIALARAIIADPQIFVMDEATSSVDTHTERAIQNAIERVLDNRISFVIAHRLSTIKNADRILVIEKGRIIEDGTHHALIRRRGQYYELYTNQFTHDQEDAVLESTRKDEMQKPA